MQTPEIRPGQGAVNLSRPRPAAGSSGPHGVDTADLQGGTVPEAARESAPVHVPLHVTLRIPASMLPTLAGCCVALVAQSEVVDGKWTGSQPLTLPRLQHADVSTAPLPEGHERVLVSGGLQESAGPVTYLTSDGRLSAGDPLEAAARLALQRPGGSDTATVNLALSIPEELLPTLGEATIALIPAHGGALAPPVDRALSYPPDHGLQRLNVPALVSITEMERDQQAELARAMDEALTPPKPADWVLEELAARGIDPDAARRNVRDHPDLGTLLGTEQGRNDYGACLLLQAGEMLEAARANYGHDKLEQLKVAVHQNRWEPLQNEDGSLAIPPEQAAVLWPAMSYYLGRANPFRDLHGLAARGELTRFDTLEHVVQALGPPGQGSKAGTFMEAVARQRMLRERLGPDGGISLHSTLGALKETSDKILEGLEVMSRVHGGIKWLSLGATALSLALAFPIGVVGGGILAVKEFVDQRRARTALEDERRVNQVLTEMIAVAGQDTEGPLVRWLADHRG
ncbi:MAG: hypothetical protein AB1758_00155 [Candidatus Eremiobacterota bacterium]